MKRLPQITSFILFITLCMSIAYWAMQLFKPPERAVAAPPQAEQQAINLDAAAALLGNQAVAAPAGNIQLKGVVVASKPSESVAVLVVSGKPPKTLKIGAELQSGVTLKEVQKRYVLLSDHGQVKRIELPANNKNRMLADNNTDKAVTGPGPVSKPFTNGANPAIKFMKPAAR